MNGFTKLFGSLITSTVWGLPDSARVVWITMLALADADGYVAASVPGLAKVSGVDREACDRALTLFLSPDPDSRTQKHEGRRIEVADGGWVLLNHGKYRDMSTVEDRKAKAAVRQAKMRERRRQRDASQEVTRERDASQEVTESHASHTIASASSSGVTSESRIDPASPPPWWDTVLDVLEANVDPERLPTVEAWLRYDGHRSGKGMPPSQKDAQYWLTTVMIAERRKAREDARHREQRDADFDAKRRAAKEGPPKPPPPSKAQEKAFADALTARLLPHRQVGT